MPPERFHFCRHCLAGLLAARNDYCIGPAPGKSQHHFAPEAPAAAGDEHGLTSEIE